MADTLPITTSSHSRTTTSTQVKRSAKVGTTWEQNLTDTVLNREARCRKEPTEQIKTRGFFSPQKDRVPCENCGGFCEAAHNN